MASLAPPEPVAGIPEPPRSALTESSEGRAGPGGARGPERGSVEVAGAGTVEPGGEGGGLVGSLIGAKKRDEAGVAWTRISDGQKTDVKRQAEAAIERQVAALAAGEATEGAPSARKGEDAEEGVGKRLSDVPASAFLAVSLGTQGMEPEDEAWSGAKDGATKPSSRIPFDEDQEPPFKAPVGVEKPAASAPAFEGISNASGRLPSTSRLPPSPSFAHPSASSSPPLPSSSALSTIASATGTAALSAAIVYAIAALSPARASAPSARLPSRRLRRVVLAAAVLSAAGYSAHRAWNSRRARLWRRIIGRAIAALEAGGQVVADCLDEIEALLNDAQPDAAPALVGKGAGPAPARGAAHGSAPPAGVQSASSSALDPLASRARTRTVSLLSSLVADERIRETASTAVAVGVRGAIRGVAQAVGELLGGEGTQGGRRASGLPASLGTIFGDLGRSSLFRPAAAGPQSALALPPSAAGSHEGTVVSSDASAPSVGPAASSGISFSARIGVLTSSSLLRPAQSAREAGAVGTEAARQTHEASAQLAPLPSFALLALAVAARSAAEGAVIAGATETLRAIGAAATPGDARAGGAGSRGGASSTTQALLPASGRLLSRPSLPAPLPGPVASVLADPSTRAMVLGAAAALGGGAAAAGLEKAAELATDTVLRVAGAPETSVLVKALAGGFADGVVRTAIDELRNGGHRAGDEEDADDARDRVLERSWKDLEEAETLGAGGGDRGDAGSDATSAAEGGLDASSVAPVVAAPGTAAVAAARATKAASSGLRASSPSPASGRASCEASSTHAHRLLLSDLEPFSKPPPQCASTADSELSLSVSALPAMSRSSCQALQAVYAATVEGGTFEPHSLGESMSTADYARAVEKPSRKAEVEAPKGAGRLARRAAPQGGRLPQHLLPSSPLESPRTPSPHGAERQPPRRVSWFDAGEAAGRGAARLAARSAGAPGSSPFEMIKAAGKAMVGDPEGRKLVGDAFGAALVGGGRAVVEELGWLAVAGSLAAVVALFALVHVILGLLVRIALGW